MKNIILCIFALIFAGCRPDPDMVMAKQTPQQAAQSEAEVNVNTRISVTRVGIFTDELAYGSRRGVYVIKDSSTGREYIGVSGIGISEIGRHSCGKNCTTRDER